MEKGKVLELLGELRDDVQFMREEGDTDLRTVLHRIDMVISKVSKENE